MEKENLMKPPKIGEIVQGEIVNKGKASIFLDLGIWGTGIIYGKEFYEARNKLKDLKIGDNVFTKIVDLENEDGFIELSLTKAGKELAWKELSEKKENNETIKVKILGANKGGILAEVSGKEKLILSEKAKETKKIKELLKSYKVGDVVETEVTGIVDFGVFVKFNADKADETLEGLIHISELDWQLIENPSEIVKLGQKIKAEIIDISKGKVSLSLKALKKDPWENIEEKYNKGDVIKGEVAKFNSFGVFIKISPQIQGLCHVSEFGSQKKMEETLKIGEKHDFKILLIEPIEHRMTLKFLTKD